jgi:alpha-galactosidase
MDNKISLIGAGSGVFSLNLIRDLCLTPNLAGSTVSFMDTDRDRLDAAYTLGRRYSREIGIDLDLQKTTDRQESLEGADFVINTALSAGHHRLQEGLSIARRHGYRFGGSHHIMHDEAFWINFYQLRLFDSLVTDILRICPRAWYIQVANPVLAGSTYLARRYGEAKVVGLCHGYRGVYELAETLRLGRDHVTFQTPGVNHFVWLTHFYHRGRDAFPLLNAWAEKEAPTYWKTCQASSSLGPKAVDLYRRFGAFPIGDTCTPGGGSWPWWYHIDSQTERQWKEDPHEWWERHHFPHVEEQVARISRVAHDTTTKVSDVFPPRRSGEVIVPLVESIACDIPRVLITNIQNKGDFVAGIPRDFEVEIPALVSKRGIEGIRTDGLPAPLISYALRDRVAPVELELEAYEQGSRELLLQLLLMDPWTRSRAQAQSLLTDILALPYHEEMRQHYT